MGEWKLCLRDRKHGGRGRGLGIVRGRLCRLDREVGKKKTTQHAISPSVQILSVQIDPDLSVEGRKIQHMSQPCDISPPFTNQLGRIHSYPGIHVTLGPLFGNTSLSERQARMRTDERPKDLEAVAKGH